MAGLAPARRSEQGVLYGRIKLPRPLTTSPRTGHGATALDFTGASTKYSDRPAAQRMADLVQNPRPVLNDVAGAFRIALRRLYRTRNIILHGGATQGVALEASLRTAAPLVGAGLDRIIHADYVESLDPLPLAARADVAPNVVNGETGLSVGGLLEPV
ncbi:hypothetical protein ACFSUJ_21050 [Streptomyces lusitanus]|uniref:hypothetical protein n=1 Tax=Streptomyces lusitanus TaxID=68232 RepID=UPI003625461E